MSYTVLARKYRPQSFDEIIGQAHVATTLSNALRSQKVAHAYLFSGPRGVGKTTTARILAKALNCEKGPTPTPCNACDSCRRIAQGQEMVDVLEIDAASNRGIEEIRELRDSVRYAPARGRYKVYIVDEAHQITHDAFNAFLKTLEEPPEHAVFVLATTEHQKIPATILSRCQLFRFKRVSSDDILAQLERILAQEKVAVERPALVRLARAAGGSVRDALSLLDQALAYAPQSLTVQQVEMLLGFLPDEFLEGFASGLLSREPAQTLQWIKRLTEEGWELPQFVRDFREYLRHALVEQLGSGTSAQQLKLAGQTVSLPVILQMIKVMGQCLDEMRWNDNPRLVLELHSLRLTQPFVDAGVLLQRLEDLEKRVGGNLVIASEPSVKNPEKGSRGNLVSSAAMTEIAASRNPMNSNSRDVPTANLIGSGTSALPKNIGGEPPRTALPSTSQGGTVPTHTSQGTVRNDNSVLWKQLLSELWKKPSVASPMERSRLKTASATEWVIVFTDNFAMDSAQRSQAFIQETLTKIAGSPLAVRFVLEAPNPAEEPAVLTRPREKVERPSAPPQAQDAAVQKVLDTFKGRVREPEGLS